MLSQIAFAETIPVKLGFDKDNYEFSYNEKGELVITPKTADACFSSNYDEPALPFTGMKVLAPINTVFSATKVNAHRSVLLENVVMSLNPVSLPTDGSMKDFVDTRVPDYKPRVYPEKIVDYAGRFSIAGNNILGFVVSPFEYDAAEKKLYFNSSIEIDVDVTESELADSLPARHHMDDIINSQVVNPDFNHDIDTLLVLTPPFVDYAIITCDSLRNSFQPLVDWKNLKGVKTMVYTVEYIAEHYEGATLQLKIKSFIRDFYINHGLKYVLLGGDAEIVPVQRCYMQNSTTICEDMPVDMFYSCLSGQFNWNANGNERIGEKDVDGVDLGQSVALTRTPVRANVDVTNFVNKTLYYERTPSQHGWHDKILLSGTKLYYYHQTSPRLVSDAEHKCNSIFSSAFGEDEDEDSIMPRFRFYDTYTDNPAGASYQLYRHNLQAELRNGYAFMEMYCHGGHRGWKMEDEQPIYDRGFATTLVSPQPLIISTIACSTNAFDLGPGPSLSKNFMIGGTNGVIGYWGCSREGWVGASDSYDINFFKKIQTKDDLGKIALDAKFALVQNTNDATYWWLQLGINPLGDAEMPVFTTTPQSFTDITVNINPTTRRLYVSTGVDSCNICVSTPGNYNIAYGSLIMGDSCYYQFENNVSSAVFNNVFMPVTVCITKYNYIPYVFDINLNAQSPSHICSMLSDHLPPNVSVLGVSGLNDVGTAGLSASIRGDNIIVDSAAEGIVRIFSSTGQLMIKDKVSIGTNAYDCSHFTNGVYIVNVSGNSFKVIK